jgi:hypothetical protein
MLPGENGYEIPEFLSPATKDVERGPWEGHFWRRLLLVVRILGSPDHLELDPGSRRQVGKIPIMTGTALSNRVWSFEAVPYFVAEAANVGGFGIVETHCGDHTRLASC